MKIGIVGCFGRVGSQIVKILQKEKHNFVGYSRKGQSEDFQVMNSMDDFIQEADCIVDFSHPDLMKELLLRLQYNPKPLLSGTTSHNNGDILYRLSEKAPVLWSTNMSLGISIMLNFIEDYMKFFEGFDISIIEIHHRNKVDSPSGTAITLKERLQKKSPEKNVEISSIRAGNIYGRHSLMFVSNDEIIEINHHALNRKLFALNAIKAVKILIQEKPGFYSIENILNVR